MNKRSLVAIWIATAAATLPLAALAHADPPYQYQEVKIQSPSGNIHCALFNDHGQGRVWCRIDHYTYAVPPRPASCEPQSRYTWGDFFAINQGKPASMECAGNAPDDPARTLDYGQTQSVGAMTCDSEPAGMTCTDTSTGHYFRISQDSYEGG
jgi:Family of unknown function (DUF6636)